MYEKLLKEKEEKAEKEKQKQLQRVKKDMKDDVSGENFENSYCNNVLFINCYFSFELPNLSLRPFRIFYFNCFAW